MGNMVKEYKYSRIYIFFKIYFWLAVSFCFFVIFKLFGFGVDILQTYKKELIHQNDLFLKAILSVTLQLILWATLMIFFLKNYLSNILFRYSKGIILKDKMLIFLGKNKKLEINLNEVVQVKITEKGLLLKFRDRYIIFYKKMIVNYSTFQKDILDILQK